MFKHLKIRDKKGLTSGLTGNLRLDTMQEIKTIVLTQSSQVVEAFVVELT